MANTYTQLFIQLVFAVKHRNALILPQWKERLHQYITGIIQGNNHKMLQVICMQDHIHIFIGLHPQQSISSLVQNVKAESTKWIKQQNLSSAFAWQEGYGAFSYSKSQVTDVIRYIQNQETHHQKQSFIEEYRSFLKAFAIDYNEQYIFKEPI